MKLHIRAKSRLRAIFYVLIILFSYIIQCTVLPRTGIPFSVMLLIPAVLSISMFEKELPSMLAGLFAGALWDLASPVTDGTLAFILAVAALTVSLLTRYLLRNTLLGALVINTAVIIIITAVYIIFSLGGEEYAIIEAMLLRHFLPSAFVTLFLTVPCYFVIRFTAIRAKRLNNFRGKA